MRVVFLTHNYPRHEGDIAGAFLANLAEALVVRGIDVRVIAPSDEGRALEGEVNGVSIRRVRYASARQERIAYRGALAEAVRTPSGIWALAGLWRALRRGAEAELANGADLVHAHWWVPAGLAAPARAPLVLTCHGTDAAMLARSALTRRMARGVFHRARVVSAVSREMGAWIQDAVGRYVGPEHVHPMPAQVERYRWSVGGGGAFVVARLSAQKRVDLAIRCIGFLHTLGADLPLTIVGDGPERGNLEMLAQDLGVASLVHFAGAARPEEVPQHLATADLMFFPAAAEGFGLTAAEALMSGVPVIACWDGGGVLDIVPERGAGRRTLPTADAMADATLDLMADDGRHVAAREAGVFWRQRLAPATVARVCEAWYREALHA